MKKLLLIPTVIFPYLLCIGLGTSSSDVFMNICVIVLLACIPLAVVLNIVFMVLCRKHDAVDLLKTALIIKLIHIPTYILIYVIGLFMGLMFFMTFPLILFLVFIDYITLILSSMISVFALIKNLKNNKAVSILTMLCQIFFCVDVISLFIANCVIKKQTKPDLPTVEN